MASDDDERPDPDRHGLDGPDPGALTGDMIFNPPPLRAHAPAVAVAVPDWRRFNAAHDLVIAELATSEAERTLECRELASDLESTNALLLVALAEVSRLTAQNAHRREDARHVREERSEARTALAQRTTDLKAARATIADQRDEIQLLRAKVSEMTAALAALTVGLNVEKTTIAEQGIVIRRLSDNGGAGRVT